MSADPAALPRSVPDAAPLLTEVDVLEAITNLDRGVPHAFGESTFYDLVHGGHRYPPKAVFGLAIAKYLGRTAVPADFTGGEDSLCFRVLRNLGFRIEPKPG